MTTATRYWFRAKRYGWGWGLPATWQGWVSLSTYLVVMIGAGWSVDREPGLGGVLVPVMIAATFGMVALCLRFGEPPRWRWGGDD